MSGFTGAHAYALVAVVVLVAVAAFFGAGDAALSRMTRSRAERLAAEGRKGAGAVVALLDEPVRSLNILALLVLIPRAAGVALLTVVATGWLGDALAVVAGALVGSVLVFVFAEVAPKTVALQHPDAVACRTATWLRRIGRPLSPVASVLIRLGTLLTPGQGSSSGPFVSEERLRDMVDVAESDEVIEESEREMIHSIFELGETVVREVMVPRPDMVCVPSGSSLREVVDELLASGHSRVPVYRDENRDEIAGMVYAKDVLARLHTGDDQRGPWEDLIRDPYFVPELKSVDTLLTEMQSDRVHCAVAVDEYGAIAGLVTIEDILEEIVGEIVDEYDSEESFVEPLAEGRWRLDGRLPIANLAEMASCELPQDEWDTVGGLLFGLLGHVPSDGEQAESDGVRLTAERVNGRRIVTVTAEKMAVAEQDPSETESPEAAE